MIFILNLRSSNCLSVSAALTYLGKESSLIYPNQIISLPERSLLIIPGVGSMASISEEIFSEIDHKILVDFIHSTRLRLFGICLGFQFLFSNSSESINSQTLDLIPGSIEQLYYPPKPSVGWFAVKENHSHSLDIELNELINKKEFYFTHSYGLKLEESQNMLGFDMYTYQPSACCDLFVIAMFGKFISGVQFHPEKSGRNGLKLLDYVVSSHIVK